LIAFLLLSVCFLIFLGRFLGAGHAGEVITWFSSHSLPSVTNPILSNKVEACQTWGVSPLEELLFTPVLLYLYALPPERSLGTWESTSASPLENPPSSMSSPKDCCAQSMMAFTTRPSKSSASYFLACLELDWFGLTPTSQNPFHGKKD
jgi:hypothetical protein